MKLFIKNILYFVLGYLILNIVFYFLVFKPAIFEKYIYNEKNISEYNLFLVSDSHGAYIEDVPNEFGISNLSYTGDNYLDMYLKIKYFSKKISRKDTILLSIDNHQLSSYREGSRNIDKSIIYSSDFSEIDVSDLKKKYYLKECLKFLPFCYTDFNKMTSKFIKFNMKYNEIIPPDQSYSKLDSLSQQKACLLRYKSQFDNKHRSENQVLYLKKIIELCAEKGIVLIGIKFPITEAYWNMISKHDYGAEALLRNNHIDVLDFHDLFFDKNIYFYDQDHLNTQGGKLFCLNVLSRIHKK